MKTEKNHVEEEHEAVRVASRKRLFAVSAIILLAVSSGIAYIYLAPTPVQPRFSLKAVIVDQLALNFPDPDFVQQASAYLNASGFAVEYYYNETLDVEFFRNLTKGNYGIVILRVHSALRSDNSSVDFFTAEPFNMTQHVSDRDNGLVVKGVLNYATGPKEYFGITPAFIESLDRSFPKSIVVAMGCFSLKPDLKLMADAFMKRGAQAYIGWDNWVGPSHTDAETLNLLRWFSVWNATLSKAVSNTLPDPTFFGSRMRLYPESAGDVRISDLIVDARSQSG